jgi:hypothetical protein
MTPQQPKAANDTRQDPFRFSRLDAAQACHDFRDADHPHPSQRQFAQEHSIPRSTLGYWMRQGPPEDLEPALVAFLQSPPGERFLRRIVCSALMVFHQGNACGIRPVGRFLELAQLDCFVGSSYGALYGLSQNMQHHLGVFDDEERPRLAKDMTPRSIAVCGDENFHGPQQCLVAIEPCSNFILVEAYRDHRDAETWTKVVQEGVKGLPVEVLLLCSDRAKGLTCCAREGLAVLHSEDLFHHQRDLCQPLLLPLTRPIRQAEKDLQEATARTDRLNTEYEEALAGQRRPGSINYFDAMLESARAEARARERAQQGQERLEQALAAVRGLADDYHPFDRQTGSPVTAEEVQRRLEGRVEALQQVVEQADLPAQAQGALEQARSALLAMVALVAWFWVQTRQRVEELALSEEGERLVDECLLPGCYWEAAARRARDGDERGRLRKLAEELQKEAWAEDGALGRLEEQERQEVVRVSRQCAGLFARSSSCVEGRNGRLSLHHHGHTRLSAARLKALTVVHNYVSRRPDGTTAAERFFGSKPRDVFTWLLERMPDLPRPAAKRPKKDAQGLAKAG